MKLAKKLTTKVILGGPVKAAFMKTVKDSIKEDGSIPDGIKTKLYDVYGKAASWAVKETDLGESIVLKGVFEAVNAFTTEKTRSGMLYLPGSAAEMISGLLGDDAAVEFALAIFIVSDAASNTGYVYEVETLMAPSEEDPLARIAAALPKPAPAPAPAPAPVSIPAPASEEKPKAKK